MTDELRHDDADDLHVDDELSDEALDRIAGRETLRFSGNVFTFGN